MRKLNWLIYATLIVAGTFGPSQPSTAADTPIRTRKVCILLWQGTEPRYAAIAKTIRAQLPEEGYPETGTAITVLDAGGNKDSLDKVVTQALAENPDVLVPVGTTIAVATAQKEKKKPIVFALVFNPVESGLAKDWESSGNNTTGASSFISTAKFLRRLNEHVPLRRIAVLYQPGTRSSEIQLAGVRDAKLSEAFKVEAIPVKDPKQIPAMIAQQAGKVDAFYVATGTSITPNASKLVEAAIKAKLLTITEIEDMVDRGVMIGLVQQPEELGRMAAKKIAQVLGGAQPSSIRIEYPAPQLSLNLKTAKAMGYAVPDGLRKWAKHTIE